MSERLVLDICLPMAVEANLRSSILCEKAIRLTIDDE